MAHGLNFKRNYSVEKNEHLCSIKNRLQHAPPKVTNSYLRVPFNVHSRQMAKLHFLKVVSDKRSGSYSLLHLSF